MRTLGGLDLVGACGSLAPVKCEWMQGITVQAQQAFGSALLRGMVGSACLPGCVRSHAATLVGGSSHIELQACPFWGGGGGASEASCLLMRYTHAELPPRGLQPKDISAPCPGLWLRRCSHVDLGPQLQGCSPLVSKQTEPQAYPMCQPDLCCKTIA